ncbi:MAG: hypothetical protein Tsb0016_25890 [Sphingomonadales bacterium]
MPFVKFLNEGEGLGSVVAREPKKYNPFLAMGHHIMVGPSEFSFAERELIAVYVSALNACAFCVGTHVSIAKALGQDPALVEALVDDPDKAPVPDKLKPVMAYVRKLTLSPAKLVQADADAVLAAGWSDQALSDAVAVAAYFAMANRLADGHGVEGLTAALNESIGAQVAAHGYPEVDDLQLR